MRVLTGVKPTHIPHLGNYLGAIKPAIQLAQSAKESFLFIADYHSLTTIQKGSELRDFTYQVAATWIACGVDPNKTIIYRQSDVPELFELAWILANQTPKGLMNRAHAYKAKVQENEETKKDDLDFGVSMGLFAYPVLMSADILLFNADVVPVGEDQVQHIEIARDIAQKFNRTYDEVFKLPRAHIQAKTLVPGLDGRKMSKSYGNHIPLFQDSKAMRKLVMKIVTDSLPPEAPKDPETSNIFQLYKQFATKEQISELEALYGKGIGWGVAKEHLFNVLDAYFARSRDKFNTLMSDTKVLEDALLRGAERARVIAQPLMKQVRTLVRGL
jgi:tryptophanyl-tRNA synthetase